jgi:hypothetical protein
MNKKTPFAQTMGPVRAGPPVLAILGAKKQHPGDGHCGRKASRGLIHYAVQLPVEHKRVAGARQPSSMKCAGCWIGVIPLEMLSTKRRMRLWCRITPRSVGLRLVRPGHRHHGHACAFDLIELDGFDLR